MRVAQSPAGGLPVPPKTRCPLPSQDTQQGYISNLNDVVVEIKAAGSEDTQGSMELASAAHVVGSVEGAELADF